MVDKLDKAKEYPVYEENMSKLQQIDFVTSSLARTGLTDIKTSNVKPAQIGGASGVDFNLDGKYASGLNMKGRVSMAAVDAGLNTIVFVAPAQYYYDRDIAEVESIIKSASFK